MSREVKIGDCYKCNWGSGGQEIVVGVYGEEVRILRMYRGGIFIMTVSEVLEEELYDEDWVYLGNINAD